MTSQHPITPPVELIARLHAHWFNTGEYFDVMLTQAFQAGADTELEACCEWLEDTDCDDPQEAARLLSMARRPKSPSLKELALLQLDTLNADLAMHGRGCDLSQIRRALEQLDD